jgi:hypothetical protein
MTEVFEYSDADGGYTITIGEEELQFTFDMNQDLASVQIVHCPHSMEDFCEFLLAAAYELQAELGRQEMEGLL